MSKLQPNKSSTLRPIVFVSAAFVLATLIGANAQQPPSDWQQRTSQIYFNNTAKSIHQDRHNQNSHGRLVSINKSTLDLSTLTQASFGDQQNAQ